MEKKISIIMPVYNRLDIFQKALASVLDQDFENTEIIVVDDGSDPCVPCDRDNVIYMRQDNAGAAAARNAGAKRATGEYIIFWDADIVAPNNFLFTLCNTLESNQEQAYAYCDFEIENGKRMHTGMFSEQRLKKQNYIHTTSLIRRSRFEEFDISLTRFQDWDLWLRILSKGGSGIFVENISFRIISAGTLSTWLPRYAYLFPFKHLPFWRKKVHAYERAKEIITRKHSLT